jgi:putative hemolysin
MWLSRKAKELDDSSYLGVLVQQNTSSDTGWVEYVILVGLIFLNAFFAASEIAIVTVRKARVRQLAEDGNGGARAVLRLNENSSKLLATIQVGVTLAGFFSAAFGAVSLARVFEGLFKLIPLNFISSNANGIAFFIVTVIIAFLSLLFGELIPKTFAIELAEPIALRVARPIELIARIFAPLVWLLTTITNFFIRLSGSNRRATLPSVSEEEIMSMVETGHEEGVVEKQESQIITNVFDFSDRTVNEIMVPRLDVHMMVTNTTVHEAGKEMLASGYSRYPVFAEGNRERIEGVVYVKDVLKFILDDKSNIPVKELLRPALFVPESKRLGDLLSELQKSRTQIAIVIDEYGGLAGIVTLEDCIEELVGEIQDEFDEETPPIIPQGENVYLVDGGLSLDDLNEALDINITEEKIDTVGGLVLTRLGRVANVGDTIVLQERRRIVDLESDADDEYQDIVVTIRVEQVEGLRIRQVSLIIQTNKEIKAERAKTNTQRLTPNT